MSECRAIEGDYADFKLIRTRKVCQIVVEVPIERAEEVTRLLGFPKPSETTRCAVALLNKIPAPTTSGLEREGDSVRRDAAPSQPIQKPNSQRCVMMAKDVQVWEFLGTYAGLKTPLSEAEAEAAIKFLCNVTSKTELNDRPKAAEAFERLRNQFYAWRRDRAA